MKPNMASVANIAVVTITVIAAVLGTGGETSTDQSRIDRLEELNNVMKIYLEFIKLELKSFNITKGKVKEIEDQSDAAFIVHKLMEQSWLHSMKPDERYFMPQKGKTLMDEEQKIVHEVKELSNKTPVTDLILLYYDVDEVFKLVQKKTNLEEDIKEINDYIAKVKTSRNFDKVEQIQSSIKTIEKDLKQIEKNLKKFQIFREMCMQSYVLDFGVQSNRNILKIEHSSEIKGKEFPMPLLNTLSILEEINKNK